MRSLSWFIRCALVFVLVATVSCSFGDDDDDPEPSPPTATATEAAQQTSTETSTEQPDPSPTSTEAGSATATATATTAATATPSPTATPPIIGSPFAESVAPHTVIDNYTLRFEMKTTGDENSETNALINYDQQTPTRYHLLSAGTNPNILPLEIWILDDQAFTTLPDGTITAVPGDVDANLFRPDEYLSRVPDLAGVEHAMRIGREEVNGRLARHYQIDAADLETAILRLPADPVVMNGVLDVWVDWEHSFVSRIEGTVKWEDAEGVEHSTEIKYEISEVGTTPEIQSPA